MMKIEFEDKKLWGVLSLLFVLAIAVPSVYMLFLKIAEGNPYMVTEDMERKATVDGYETPEEVMEYVLYWIQHDDLDLALRGCAIEEVAGYFSTQGYCEILDKFPDCSKMLGPADYDNQGYIEINQARMTAVYSDMLEQCMGSLGSGYDVEVLNIYSDIPENADGFYYQDIRDIGSVTGARDACNVEADLLVDGVPRKMTVTAARYRQHWKILQFSEYKNYKYKEPQISEVSAPGSAGELPIAWEAMDTQILPCNYAIAADSSEKDLEALIEQWFIYMQRGDMWKALALFDIYDSEAALYVDSIFFSRQAEAAKQLQRFYYDLFLYDEDSLSWIKQNPKDEALNLINLLDARFTIYTKLGSMELVEKNEDYAKYRVKFDYAKRRFTFVMEFTYRDGWKITRVQMK